MLFCFRRARGAVRQPGKPKSIAKPIMSSSLQLVLFFAGAFAFTWFWHFQIVRKKLTIAQGRGLVLYVIGFPGPALAAIGVAWLSGSLDFLLQRLLPSPAALGWLLPALFVLPSIYLAAAGIAARRTGLKPDRLFHRPAIGWTVLLLQQIYVICSEEIGWRGFALPLLIGIFGAVGGTIVLGLVWALWHLPMFLVPNSHQKGAFRSYAYTLIAWSALMTFLVVQSGGNILPAMAFHAAANICFFVIDVPPQAERYAQILLGLAALGSILFFPGPWFAFYP